MSVRVYKKSNGWHVAYRDRAGKMRRIRQYDWDDAIKAAFAIARWASS
jgi:hypothetical protein